MRIFNKVFVTSLPRCATVSLGQALAVLGIPTAHLGRIYWPPQQAANSAELPPAQHSDPLKFIELFKQINRDDYDLDILRTTRGLADYPACCLLRLNGLIRQYPDSLCIHVGRDRSQQAWLQSVERQFVGLDQLEAIAPAAGRTEFMQALRAFRRETFGDATFDATTYRQAYHAHQAAVARLARQAPDRWLLFEDIDELPTQGLERLASFLHVPTPAIQFPHASAHSQEATAAFADALRQGKIRSQTGCEP